MTGPSPKQYEYHVRGELSDVLLGAFPELEATRRPGETILSGLMPDQAALFGVLARIEALGIQLIEVRLARSGLNGAACDHGIAPSSAARTSS